MAAGDSTSATNVSLNEVLKAIEHHNLHLSPDEIRLLRLKLAYASENFNDSNKLIVDFCKDQKIILDTEDILPKSKSIWPSFHGNKYFSTLTLNYGSYESPLLEATKSSAWGFKFGGKPYKFNKVVPGMYMCEYGFQKTMEKIFKDMLAVKVVVYLDSVFVFSKSEDELYGNVREVFEQLSKTNLPLDGAVCTIFQKSLELLGYRVSKNKLKVPPKVLEVVKSINHPKTLIELFEFMVLVGFYKEMIKSFARLAAPLTELMDTPQSVLKDIEWQQQRQVSFQVLQKKLLNEPVLAICHDKAEKILYVTSSANFIEGDLYQIDMRTNEKTAVGYFSARVESAMKNWKPFDLEMLAITESCLYFQAYLKQSVTVYATNPPQTYRERFKNPAARLKNLKSRIDDISIKIQHVSMAEAADSDFYELTEKNSG